MTACPLRPIRDCCESPSQGVRWACVLEATAPKVGNVFPGRPFSDLTYQDFVQAATISADIAWDDATGFTAWVQRSAAAVADQIGTNVNLGILLLLGPLVQVDREATRAPLRRADWQRRVGVLLGKSTAEDTARIYRAIRLAAPGGMGRQGHNDVFGPPPEDLIAAMSQAAQRDRIAHNYAQRFEDVFYTVTPLVEQAIAERGDLLGGISLAQRQMLCRDPDSLIARKAGVEVALEVQRRARSCGDDSAQWQRLDAMLRRGRLSESGADESQSPVAASGRLNPGTLNPGTTADLIAAALYILLRERSSCGASGTP